MLGASTHRPARPRGFGDWSALAEAWVRLLAVDLCLRVLPFRWVERRLGSPRPGNEHADPRMVSRCVWAAGAAARHHLWPMHCLPHSLVLARMLRRRGIAAELRIGVAREPDRLLAHAWVEWEGRALGETTEGLASFTPLSG